MTLLSSDAAWPVIVSDSFDRALNFNDWPVGKRADSGIDSHITDGKYRWTFTSAKDRSWWAIPKESATSDFTVTTEAGLVSPPGNIEYGLVFRQQDVNSYYRFVVDGNRYYTVQMLYQSQWHTLVNWQPSTALHAGINKLAVSGRGSHFVFMINDHYVDNMDDNQLKMGRVGLAFDYGPTSVVAVEFSRFELRGVAAAPAVVTPTPIPTDSIPPPQATATAQARWPILLSDSFGVEMRSKTLWPSGAIAPSAFQGERTFPSGQYRWTVQAQQGGTLAGVANMPVVGDFFMSAAAHRLEGTDAAEYGLAFHYVDEDNFYRFVLKGRQFAVIARVNGQETALIPFRDAPAIQPNDVNRLTLNALQNHFTFYIGDEKVGEIADTLIPGGRAGFAVTLPANAGGTFEFGSCDLRAPRP
ncbi:MAG: hypothetical protein WCF84_05625 [Anaerolineae bacterium]